MRWPAGTARGSVRGAVFPAREAVRKAPSKATQRLLLGINSSVTPGRPHPFRRRSNVASFHPWETKTEARKKPRRRPSPSQNLNRGTSARSSRLPHLNRPIGPNEQSKALPCGRAFGVRAGTNSNGPIVPQRSHRHRRLDLLFAAGADAEKPATRAGFFAVELVLCPRYKWKNARISVSLRLC